ncbi:MAG: MoxR family ATPase [Alphaproteobacteria bacterium]|nr:MoxR family ATPase [Alphaproteobacteria bacterium]
MSTLSTSTNILSQDPVAVAERIAARFSSARKALRGVILGDNDVVDLALITLLSAGHGLIVGVPGLAKTKLVETLGIVLGLETKRVQFTPDLMPADITGSEVLEESAEGRRSFRFIKGPVFTSLLMADEINRASPRTQSALLQAMQEHHVTVSGNRYDLPTPFHVFATQNPIEQEGTYPLPEAQLDRFLMQIDVAYPDAKTEKDILIQTTRGETHQASAILTTDELIAAQNFVRMMPIGDSVVDAILALVRAARPESGEADCAEHISWGPGPRAGQALMLTTRARALLQGRLAPSQDDVAALALPILKHRMALTYRARAEGITIDDLIKRLVKRFV